MNRPVETQHPIDPNKKIVRLPGLFAMVVTRMAPPEPIPVHNAVTGRPATTLLTPQEIRQRTNRKYKACPFHPWVGQDTAIEQWNVFLRKRLKDPNRLSDRRAIMLVGPASSGKTESTKAALGPKGLDIPLIELNAKSVNNMKKIRDLIFAAAKEAGTPMEPLGVEHGRTLYKAPGMGLFLDELHGLAEAPMTELLKVLEAQDHQLIVGDEVIDVENVLWIGATTERGIILERDCGDAFDSRFEKFEYQGYTRNQVAEILHRSFPHWDIEECETVATYGGCIVRECKAIALAVDDQLEYMKDDDPDVTRMDAIRRIGEQKHIDENGMTDDQKEVLLALARAYPRGLTYDQLANAAQTKPSLLKRSILPALELDTVDHPPCIIRPSRTLITKAGMQQLLDRGLIDEEQMEQFNA